MHLSVQKKRAVWRLSPYFIPTHKGYQPFRTWTSNCIVGLQPPAPNGGTVVVIAIDAWTKWVEYRIINPLDSCETSRFLHEDIICCYGLPAVVWCDQV